MWWIPLTAWVLFAPLLGFLIGTGIRLARTGSSADAGALAGEGPCRPMSESRPETVLGAGARP